MKTVHFHESIKEGLRGIKAPLAAKSKGKRKGQKTQNLNGA